MLTLSSSQPQALDPQSKPAQSYAQPPLQFQPRLYKGPFNLQCCTTKPVAEIQQEILRASQLSSTRISQQPGSCTFHCNNNGVKFDIEVVELQTKRRNPERKLFILQFFNKSQQHQVPQAQMTHSQQQQEQLIQDRFRQVTSKILKEITL